jgi:hypothetical protein
MAVRSNWYLAITWRTSSVSGNDESCVQVACYERSALRDTPGKDSDSSPGPDRCPAP